MAKILVQRYEYSINFSLTASFDSYSFKTSRLDEVRNFEDRINDFSGRRPVVCFTLLLLEKLVVKVLASHTCWHLPEILLL